MVAGALSPGGPPARLRAAGQVAGGL
jgi:hypothetical protein